MHHSYVPYVCVIQHYLRELERTLSPVILCNLLLLHIQEISSIFQIAIITPRPGSCSKMDLPAGGTPFKKSIVTDTSTAKQGT